jgi:uncharacterized membrane protein
VTLVLAGVYIVFTCQSMPERVASHSGGAGQADGYMSRTGYTIFMLGFTIGLSLLIVFMMSRLPRSFPNLTNIPNRNYWLAPERIDQTLDYLSGHAMWFGCGYALFFCTIHQLVVQANRQNPPVLDNKTFLGAMILFLAALVVWIVFMFRRFRKPGS